MFLNENPPHDHAIVDSDVRFVVNPTTRSITTESAKVRLVQGDHNSERFTFEIPRFVESHDMLKCDKVEVHYINLSASQSQRSDGVYIMRDLQISPDDENKVICSWLVSRNATMYAGVLYFALQCVCLDGEKIAYSWNTSIYKGITISDGIYNSEVIIEMYADVLAEWERRLFDANDSGLKAIEEAKASALDDIEKERSNLLNEIELAAEIVQSAGNSETAVMSQKTATKFISEYALGKVDWAKYFQIGNLYSELGDGYTNARVSFVSPIFNRHNIIIRNKNPNVETCFYKGNVISSGNVLETSGFSTDEFILIPCAESDLLWLQISFRYSDDAVISDKTEILDNIEIYTVDELPLFMGGMYVQTGAMQSTRKDRVKFFLNVKSDTILKLNNDAYSFGLTALDGKTAVTTYSIKPTSTSGNNIAYTFHSDYIVSNTEYTICVIVKKNDDGEFAYTDIVNVLDGFQVEEYSTDDALIPLSSAWGQGTPTAEGKEPADTNAKKPYRVYTAATIVVPYDGCEIRVSVNPKYSVALMSGELPNTLNHSQYWFTDGQTITVPKGDKFMKFTVSKSDATNIQNVTDAISPEEYEDFNLRLYYKSKGKFNNSPLSGCNREFSTSNYKGNRYRLPMIAHISDVHGDAVRFEAYTKFINENNVAASCVTGDVLAQNQWDGHKLFTELMSNGNVPHLFSLGNHELRGSTLSDDAVYQNYYKDLAEKWGYLSSDGTSADKPWFYMDFADSKLRIISVNAFEYGGTQRDRTHFTADQMAWLCNTLLTTPASYGVMLIYHLPFKSLVKDAEYPLFYQNELCYETLYNAVNGYPIFDIVDAFISKSSINKTYTQTGAPSSFAVSADFSNVNDGVEFIAHLTGHAHLDRVSYVPDCAQKQLMLNIVCGISVYGNNSYPYYNEMSTLGREQTDGTQHAFNVYCIDRTKGNVKIVRIGATYTSDLQNRNAMIIPYK